MYTPIKLPSSNNAFRSCNIINNRNINNLIKRAQKLNYIFIIKNH